MCSSGDHQCPSVPISAHATSEDENNDALRLHCSLAVASVSTDAPEAAVNTLMSTGVCTCACACVCARVRAWV